jgi:sortase (surface protein transpeptidase)
MMFIGMELIVNTALNGLQDIDGMVFGRLIDLSEGDLILVSSGDTHFAYLVAEKMLLPERGQRLEVWLHNAQWIEPSEDERLTLVTC